MNGGVRKDVDANESCPSPDFIEVSVGATAEVDITPLTYPVRRVTVVTGTGTLAYQTANSGAGINRTATAAVGTKLGPAQITSIRGTSDTTLGASGSAAPTVGVSKVRVFK